MRRCEWAEGSDAEREYHDREWGVPLHDDRALFELLTLEGAQAGLSWRLVLTRRPGYRAAFHAFDIARVAAMTEAELEHVLATGAIVRNRLKVLSVRDNARAAVAAIETHGSLDRFLWQFVDFRPQINRWRDRTSVPATTPRSDTMSKALRGAGFRFVGSTICYAFMQASGMVNDHVVGCFRHAELAPVARGEAPHPP